MPWFNDKGLPASNTALKSYYSTTVDEFRKTTYTLPFISPTSAMFAVAFGASVPVSNMMSRRPIISGGPKAVFMTSVGLWIGYYFTRAYGQYYLGKFKYCFEYALSRKDMFPMKVPPKYGDPEVLIEWLPCPRQE